MADRAFAQQGLLLEQAFLDKLAGSYGAGIGAVDYRSDPEAARQAINAWVGEETHARIPELLAPGVLHHLTRLVLVNAVYLKADWAVPFSREATAPSTFHAPGGDTIVPFMRGSSPRRFATGQSVTGERVLICNKSSTLIYSLLISIASSGQFMCAT